MKKAYEYSSTVEGKEKKIGTISFSDKRKPTCEISVAPEFFGHGGIITPEDLFVSSVNTCLMSYFLNASEKMRAKFSSYKSEASATLSETGIDYVFTSVTLAIEVSVADEKQKKKAERALVMARDGCFVSNSLKADVMVEFNVSVTLQNDL